MKGLGCGKKVLSRKPKQKREGKEWGIGGGMGHAHIV